MFVFLWPCRNEDKRNELYSATESSTTLSFCFLFSCLTHWNLENVSRQKYFLSFCLFAFEFILITFKRQRHHLQRKKFTVRHIWLNLISCLLPSPVMSTLIKEKFLFLFSWLFVYEVHYEVRLKREANCSRTSIGHRQKSLMKIDFLSWVRRLRQSESFEVEREIHSRRKKSSHWNRSRWQRRQRISMTTWRRHQVDIDCISLRRFSWNDHFFWWPNKTHNG